MTKQQRQVGFAVLGCGNISESHLLGISNIEEAKLVAVCDVNEEQAKRCAEKYGVRYYTTYEELLADDEVEAVCLCTPSGMHSAQTVQAAEAGKHVVSEKPMAIRMEDIDPMIEACRQHGVWLTTIFPRRMSPASRFVKQLLQEGHLGKLSLCSAYAKFYRTQAYYDSAGWRGTWAMDGGGAMMNQGIHTIDLLQWLVGPVESLYGQAAAVLRDIEVEDTAVSALRFKSGAMGVLEMTTTAYKQPSHQIAIHGDKGTIILTEDQITTLEIDGEEVEIPEFEPFQVIPDGHRLQLRDMALAILENRAPEITGEDGRHSLELILGTYRSSRENAPIQFG